MAYLELIDVTKKFGDFTAVNNFNLSVNEGELVSFWDPADAARLQH